MKTINVALDKITGFINEDTFKLLESLFSKTNPAILSTNKDEAEKIINGDLPAKTSGSLILSRNDNEVITTYQAVAECEYYAKKFKLTGMIERQLKSAQRLLTKGVLN